MRRQGHRMYAVSVHRAARQDDPDLAQIAREALVIYSLRTLIYLPAAVFITPLLATRALGEALTADLSGIGSRLKYIIQAWMGLAGARRLAGKGIRHVHAHLANVPATVALHLARGLDARFSFTGHAADLFVHRSALRLKLQEASFVAAISHWHTDFYRSLNATVRAPVVRCGVALPETVPLPDKPHIVLIARLVQKKGVDLLLHALKLLDRSAVRVSIAGDGPESRALWELAQRLAIGENLSFLGARPHRECLALMRSASLFVLPCRTAIDGDRDGIPVVLMEAMAAGRPVIAGALPTIAELVDHGHTGILVPPDDVVSLAEAIAALLDNPGRAERLGTAARSWIAEEFSDEINLRRLESAFRAA